MASVEDAVYTRLQAVTAVTDLVSTRVYPVKKDAGPSLVFPYITYEVILSERISAMASDTGHVESTVRVHIWSKDSAGTAGFDVARNVGVAVRGALQRWAGTAGGVTVRCSFIDGEFDIGDDEPGVYHRVLDFLIHWVE